MAKATAPSYVDLLLYYELQTVLQLQKKYHGINKDKFPNILGWAEQISELPEVMEQNKRLD